MNLEAFRWQVRQFLLEEGGRVSPKICYQDWPLELEKTPAKLNESWKTSLYNFHRESGKEEIPFSVDPGRRFHSDELHQGLRHPPLRRISDPFLDDDCRHV